MPLGTWHSSGTGRHRAAPGGTGQAAPGGTGQAAPGGTGWHRAAPGGTHRAAPGGTGRHRGAPGGTQGTQALALANLSQYALRYLPVFSSKRRDNNMSAIYASTALPRRTVSVTGREPGRTRLVRPTPRDSCSMLCRLPSRCPVLPPFMRSCVSMLISSVALDSVWHAQVESWVRIRNGWVGTRVGRNTDGRVPLVV